MAKTSTPTPDEQPKKVVAKNVVARKRRYFLPEHGISVMAVSIDDAAKQVATRNKKAGDE